METTDDVTLPQAALMELVTGEWAARSVYVAAKLGIADHVAAGVRDGGALAAATGSEPVALERFLRYLVALDVLSGGDPEYALTAKGELLRSDTAGSLRAYVVIAGEEFHAAWSDVLHTAATGEPAFAHVFGHGLFRYLQENPDTAQRFHRAMSNSSPVFAQVPRVHDFSGHRLLVDIGGGNGELTAVVLQANPALRAIVQETPMVAETARAAMAARGEVGERCAVVTGDFLAGVPGGGDVHLLARVMVNWDDESCVRILTHCAGSLPPGGTLLVVDRVALDGDRDPMVFAHDMAMLVLFGGGAVRTIGQVAALLDAAGFRLGRVRGLPQHFHLVEAIRV